MRYPPIWTAGCCCGQAAVRLVQIGSGRSVLGVCVRRDLVADTVRAGWMIGMQMVERPWGVATYGAASVKPFAVESTDLDDVQQLLIDVVAAGANEIEGGEASAQDLAPGHVVVSAAVILGFSIIHD